MVALRPRVRCRLFVAILLAAAHLHGAALNHQSHMAVG